MKCRSSPHLMRNDKVRGVQRRASLDHTLTNLKSKCDVVSTLELYIIRLQHPVATYLKYVTGRYAFLLRERFIRERPIPSIGGVVGFRKMLMDK